MQQSVTISKDEYERLLAVEKLAKTLEKIDYNLVRQFAESFEDLKTGRFKRLV